MSDDDALAQQVQSWLEPLSTDEGPCGPDLEYDNAFLELSKAAEGKPESQFERGSPPDWRSVRSMAEELFDRTRDLRVALLWLRATVNIEGVAAYEQGLALVLGLLEGNWDTVHPVPDPSDNDPYARANALAMLPAMEGGLGDLLNARFVLVKGIGDIRLRDVEIAFGNLGPREGESSYTKDQLERMFGAADEEGAGLRERVQRVQQLLQRLGTLMNERFGSGSSAELKPLTDLFAHTLQVIPEPLAAAADAPGSEGEAGEGGEPGARSARAGLSGSVNSRAEAVRAIELVCAYLERSEPTNPAQLFLKRAAALLDRNFLELLKELAPGALDEVARMVGVDPNSVGPQEE